MGAHLRGPQHITKEKGFQKSRLYEDDKQLIRCRGTVNEHSYLRLLEKQSCQKNHRITQLLNFSFHEKKAHSRVAQTVTLFLQKYWVAKARSNIRNTTRKNACFFVGGIVGYHHFHHFLQDE